MMSDDLLTSYDEVRRLTRSLCEPLTAEDMLVQSMPQASPTKWHLAHTSWFFETFLLAGAADYEPFDPRFGFLFNSYYNALGDRIPRFQRGLLSRPTLDEVMRYRGEVDAAMRRLIASGHADAGRVVLGLHHEQQHQELLLTDIKHAFAANPLRPAYRERPGKLAGIASRADWLAHPGGLVEVGHAKKGFAFDNESPRHQVYLGPFRIASRLVTCGEWLAFQDDRGYERPELWLSDGWDACRDQGWRSPLYWEKREGRWWQFTLQGMRPVREEEPVCHISYFEADAFARWSGARLPTEAEWEVVSAEQSPEGAFLDALMWHPTPAGDAPQWFGEAWQWTASPYVGYPGYQPAGGALGEYNGKFMNGQYVLRGGSCLTPRSHFRITYRNFFPPDARWQVSSLRLATDA
jgi:ergothioneine biosynthesis protein EgtB